MTRCPGARRSTSRIVTVLALFVSACAPNVSPAPPAPANVEAEVPVDADVAELARSVRRAPSGEHVVVFGDETERCLLTSPAGSPSVVELRCGDTVVRAATVQELLARVNEGALHRALAVTALLEPRWARAALGSDTATPPIVTSPDTLRFELGPPFGVAEIRLGRRGSVQIHFAGFDGRETVDAPHPRAAEKMLAARLDALREEHTRRLDTATGESVLTGFLARLDLDGRAVDGIRIGEPREGQRAFSGQAARKTPTPFIADAFPGDSNTWTLAPPAREGLRVDTTELSAETLQGRVIAVSVGGTLPRDTFSGAGGPTTHLPCDRLHQALERRFPVSASQGERFAEVRIEPAAGRRTLCAWQVVKNGLDVQLELTATRVRVSATLAGSGREALMGKARDILAARDRAKSCNLCGRVRVGSHTRSGDRVVSVDRKRCSMIVAMSDHHSPLEGLESEVPCE